jgi:hypothetical protein
MNTSKLHSRSSRHLHRSITLRKAWSARARTPHSFFAEGYGSIERPNRLLRTPVAIVVPLPRDCHVGSAKSRGFCFFISASKDFVRTTGGKLKERPKEETSRNGPM